MKALINSLLLPGILLGFFSGAYAQQYTVRDQEEIAYQAQLTLNMYKDLLNVIAYEDLASESEIRELIRNSYTPSRNQLFYSAEAIIEDNVKPSNLGVDYAQDKPVGDYLQYFDLAYEKSDNETIDFYDFEVSNLKYGRYLYIKVKYTCLFKGKHKEDPAAYRPVDRVAELRVEKRDNAWKTLITSIVYHDPLNPLDADTDDVELAPAEDGRDIFVQLSQRNGATASAERNENFTAQKQVQDSAFNYHLSMGNRALASENLDEALAAFSEAEKIYPYHQDLQLKLMELAKAQSLRINNTDNSFEYAKLNADRAYAARNFIKAKDLYYQALQLRPDNEQLKVTIETLERTIRKNALLESKYAAGEYKDAIKDYNRAIKQDKSNPDFYYGRGKTYEKLHNVKAALKDYTMAIELDGNFIEALHSRARLYTKTDQLHRAVADYTLILSNADYAASFYPERARIKKMLGDYKGAIEDYNEAIRLNPEVAGHHFDKGMIYTSRNNHKEAIRSFSEAIEKDQQHIQAFFRRGLAHAALNDIQAASADFERARQLGLEEAQLIEINKLALQHFSRAEGAMAEKIYQRALESYEHALLIAPDFGRAWLRKGDAHGLLEDYDRAIKSYDKAVEHEQLSFAYFRRGLAYLQQGDNLSASQDFKRYIPIGQELVARTAKPNDEKKSGASLTDYFSVERADALYALGYAQLMNQQFMDALENLDMAIHARKFYPEAWFARGSALYALEDYKKAVKNMEESIKMGLSDPLAFYSLGKAYVANDQLKDAVFSFTHAIKVEPQYAAAYKERAFCHKEFEQYDLALEDFNTAASLNRNYERDLQFMTQKGLTELYLNKRGEAKQSFEQALRLDGTHPWALYGKACTLAQEQKLEESLEWYKKAFQSRQIEWSAIKKDPLLDPISKEKAFKELVKTYL